MLELPEAAVIAAQIGEHLIGRRLRGVVAATTPHKLTWFAGDPVSYPALLEGKVVTANRGVGGMVEVSLGEATMVFSDGVSLRFHEAEDRAPSRHQLLLGLEGGGCLSASVQMYGGVCCFPTGTYHNEYYRAALEKPSPLTEAFSPAYFGELLAASPLARLSAKAFLATGQRIPGLGNGVLQDILLAARVHPRRKMDTLSRQERDGLHTAVRDTLRLMRRQGGRDTEKDVLGTPGGYRTRLCSRTAGTPCPACGASIEKASYMGGSVYTCPFCQRL